jgi:hypothetical protein
VTPHAFVRAVKRRARELFLLSGGEIDFAEAEKRAAQQIAAEARASRTATHAAAPVESGITVANARQHLIARVMALSQRLAHPIARPPAPTSNTPPTVLPHTSDPIAPTTPAPVAPPDQPLVAIGIFVGASSPATERIDDAEFHTSLRFADRATTNWRHSLEVNARIQQRNGRWIG